MEDFWNVQNMHLTATFLKKKISTTNTHTNARTLTHRNANRERNSDGKHFDGIQMTLDTSSIMYEKFELFVQNSYRNLIKVIKFNYIGHKLICGLCENNWNWLSAKPLAHSQLANIHIWRYQNLYPPTCLIGRLSVWHGL